MYVTTNVCSQLLSADFNDNKETNPSKYELNFYLQSCQLLTTVKTVTRY